MYLRNPSSMAEDMLIYNNLLYMTGLQTQNNLRPDFKIDRTRHVSFRKTYRRRILSKISTLTIYYKATLRLFIFPQDFSFLELLTPFQFLYFRI